MNISHGHKLVRLLPYYICFMILYCLLAQEKWKRKNGLRLMPTLPYNIIFNTLIDLLLANE